VEDEEGGSGNSLSSPSQRTAKGLQKKNPTDSVGLKGQIHNTFKRREQLCCRLNYRKKDITEPSINLGEKSSSHGKGGKRLQRPEVGRGMIQKGGELK